jgi:hyaluronan synthase/N-acetylglucosaminyltransferase
MTLGYLWYRYIFRFIWQIKKKHTGYDFEDFAYSVVVPVYNEKPHLLEQCVRSLVESKGTKEIIVVDDGCKDSALLQKMNDLKKEFGIILLHQENKGKRYAQRLGIEKAKYPYIVTVDSDSTVSYLSIIRLLQPFRNVETGAVTGRCEALNRNDNLLTKMIDARYKNAFGFERASLSALGVVTCCSGVLSGYKKEIILPLMDRYVHQRFLGEECTYGDDRHLTNLILMQKYKVEYVDEAIVLTEVPDNYRQFLKQQLRWKKSFLRESLVTLSFSFKTSFWLTFEVLWNLILPYFSLGARISMIYLLITNPMEIFSLAIGIITIAFVRNLLLFFEDRKSAYYSIPYAFFHELVLYWLFFYAPFKLKDRKWGTR